MKDRKGEKNKKYEKRSNELNEDTTKYGEFISTYFAWLPLSKQKENAKKLENITKDK